MPSPRRLARQLANRRVPLRTRLGLVAVGARRIVDSSVDGMPVIDNDGRVIGAMTVDAAIAVLFASTAELQKLRILS